MDGTNLQVQTHCMTQIMHQNLAVTLRQLGYGKISFAVSVPERQRIGEDVLQP